MNLKFKISYQDSLDKFSWSWELERFFISKFKISAGEFNWLFRLRGKLISENKGKFLLK